MNRDFSGDSSREKIQRLLYVFFHNIGNKSKDYSRILSRNKIDRDIFNKISTVIFPEIFPKILQTFSLKMTLDMSPRIPSAIYPGIPSEICPAVFQKFLMKTFLGFLQYLLGIFFQDFFQGFF